MESQKLVISPAPHVHGKNDTRRMMGDVLIALLPALGCSVLAYGWQAFVVVAFSVACCVLVEWFIQRFMLKGPSTLGNLSAIVTGVLLGFNLPANIPLWLVAVAAVVANLILKPLIARERPCWSNEDVELLVAMPQDFSFPSGHTLHSVMVAVVIFMYDKRIGSLAIIMAVLISFSRLYLYVHFPSDVLCGALLGTVFSVAGYYLTKFIVSKSEKLQELFPEGKSE